jgi:hypothetical protein
MGNMQTGRNGKTVGRKDIVLAKGFSVGAEHDVGKGLCAEFHMFETRIGKPLVIIGRRRRENPPQGMDKPASLKARVTARPWS